jgi:hypothetical protein
MSGFKIDVKSAPWWSMGQVQYEVVSPDGRCVYRTPDFGLSLRVRDVWESIQGWTSLLKEKVEMTDEQKDAIVNAAQRYAKKNGLVLELMTTNPEGYAIVDAVRSAERRWTWELVGKEGLVRHDGAFVFSVRSDSGEVFGVMPEMCRKLARLLNEDDANGEK